MAQYIGITAIAKRLGVSTTTIRRKYQEFGYPCYLVRLRGNAVRWVSNDDLIYAWELQQVEKCRKAYRYTKRRQDMMARKDKSVNSAA